MRKRLYQIIEVSQDGDRISAIYDVTMMIAIVISIIPLALKSTPRFFFYTDIVAKMLKSIDFIRNIVLEEIILKNRFFKNPRIFGGFVLHKNIVLVVIGYIRHTVGTR